MNVVFLARKISTHKYHVRSDAYDETKNSSFLLLQFSVKAVTVNLTLPTKKILAFAEYFFLLFSVRENVIHCGRGLVDSLFLKLC